MAIPMRTLRKKPPQRIAVIGSGAAGLAAAWALSKRHDVQLFEAGSHFGGHAHTVDLDLDGVRMPVDTGFIVLNDVNYPSLTAAFAELGVATDRSNMSFSVSCDSGQFEYSGRWPGGVVAQKRNLLSPAYWAMLRDIRRFYAGAMDALPKLERDRATLADYLAENRFSRTFRNRHLLPMVGAIWSQPVATAESMPAAAVIRFFEAHGLLRLRGRPQWRTVTGGSRSYVEAILADMSAHVYLDHRARAVVRDPDGVTVRFQDRSERFDQVVLATQGDQALALLEQPSQQERRVLGAFRYCPNRAVLHSDERLMPRRRSAWASWNFIEGADGGQGLTYWMNLLQRLPTERPVFVTLNPPFAPERALAHGTFDYRHPVFDQGAIDAQAELDSLQGHARTWFCGSYFGYGFHEDAFSSGLRVASRLGAQDVPAGDAAETAPLVSSRA